MSDSEAPRIANNHHFSPTVTDVERSAAWYEQVFGMVRLPMTFPHHEREDTGYAVLLIDPGWLTDLIGAALAVGVVAPQTLALRDARAQTAKQVR